VYRAKTTLSHSTNDRTKASSQAWRDSQLSEALSDSLEEDPLEASRSRSSVLVNGDRPTRTSGSGLLTSLTRGIHLFSEFCFVFVFYYKSDTITRHRAS
jgi:hypothetical protein